MNTFNSSFSDDEIIPTRKPAVEAAEGGHDSTSTKHEMASSPLPEEQGTIAPEGQGTIAPTDEGRMLETYVPSSNTPTSDPSQRATAEVGCLGDGTPPEAVKDNFVLTTPVISSPLPMVDSAVVSAKELAVTKDTPVSREEIVHPTSCPASPEAVDGVCWANICAHYRE